MLDLQQSGLLGSASHRLALVVLVTLLESERPVVAAGAAFAAAALRLKLQEGAPIMAGVLATGDASHGCGEGPAGETGYDDEQ